MTRVMLFGTDRDDAISAVVGTILMIAATVALGATVYAVINGFGGNEVEDGETPVFKAEALDTDNDGLKDRIKISYLNGPELASSAVTATVRNETAVAPTQLGSTPSTWKPGDYTLYKDLGTYFVSVKAKDQAVLDTVVQLEE